jgi:hypothetical protein
MSSSKTCEMLEFCISRAMTYANKGDYGQAVASFMSDVRKTDCTKCLLEGPSNSRSTMTVLNDAKSKTSPAEFEEILRGFSLCCVCVSNN